MKKLLVMAAAITAVLVMAIPAHAAGVLRTTDARAELPVFPGAGNVSTLTGSVQTVGSAPSGALGLGTGGVQYNETTCERGTATGNITIGSSGDIHLSWQRVGALAVLTLSGNGQTGVAVALFNANLADFQNDCLPGHSGPMSAGIIAVGVAVP